jgi:hypothetical protein
VRKEKEAAGVGEGGRTGAVIRRGDCASWLSAARRLGCTWYGSAGQAFFRKTHVVMQR